MGKLIKDKKIKSKDKKSKGIKKKEKKSKKVKINDTEVTEKKDNHISDDENEPKVDYSKVVRVVKDKSYLTETTFESLELSDKLKHNISEMGFTNLTEIQQKAIPSLLAGNDVLGQAQTGSGKTLAFLIPCIELLYRAKFKSRNGTGVIIITPTRELAMQIYYVATELLAKMPQTHALIMGGSNKHYEEVKLSKGSNLIVATPGRLLDHLINTKFNYNNLIALVVDETDRILEVGFEEEIKAIVKLLPRQNRQSMLFSATQTTNVTDIARLSLNQKPVFVGVEAKISTVNTLDQAYIVTETKSKFLLLFSFLKRNLKKKIIVFFAACDEVKYYSELLNYINIPVLGLHGKMKQKNRTNSFFNFCNSESGILLCTDVAARGLDIPSVNWIIQYDPPENPDEYIHRVGRTARGGSKGRAVLFLLPEERAFLKYLKDKKVPLNEIDFPTTKISNIQSKLEKITKENYYLCKIGSEAFKSFIRSYAAHSLKDVFDINNLNIQELSSAFGLTFTPLVNINHINIGLKNTKKKKKKSQKWTKKNKKV